MSLDTYGFFTDCGCCIRHGMSKMQHSPLSDEGIAEATASFGPLWDKYKPEYLYFAKVYQRELDIAND